MTRLNRILALALTLVLMLGAVAGVVGSAEEGSANPIVAVNVAYEDKIAPMFAIDRTGVAEASTDISVTFDGVEAVYVGSMADLKGKPVAIFKSQGVVAKRLGDNLDVVIVIDGETTVVSYNVVNNYFRVMLNSATATAAQKALYQATIDYAAAAKAHFG